MSSFSNMILQNTSPTQNKSVNPLIADHGSTRWPRTNALTPERLAREKPDTPITPPWSTTLAGLWTSRNTDRALLRLVAVSALVPAKASSPPATGACPKHCQPSSIRHMPYLKKTTSRSRPITNIGRGVLRVSLSYFDLPVAANGWQLCSLHYIQTVKFDDNN